MLTRVTQHLQEVATEAAWRQWDAVGSFASSKRKATAIIDPEALVLLSLILREKEHRLWDVLSWWAIHRSRLLSVQRMKNVSRAYPEPAHQKLKEFVYLALREGKDFRWKSLPASAPSLPARPKKGTEPAAPLLEPSSLMLRMRLGLGVGIKADLLSVLVGLEERPATVKALAYATAYAPRAIRRAADELAEAQLIRTYNTKEASLGSYYLDANKWRNLMGINSPGPRWRYLHSIFAFVSHVLTLEHEIIELRNSSYLLSSHLRDVVEHSLLAFGWNQIMIPELVGYPGVSFLEAFEEIVRITAEWIAANV